MAWIIYKDKKIESRKGETILDCLIRSGEKIPNSCRSGVCQSCVLKTKNAVSASSQKGLSEKKRLQGFFLSCQEVADKDMDVLESKEAATWMDGTISYQKKLTDSVVLIRICFDSQPMKYQAGQFINLCREDGLCRSYSIGNESGQDYLELHVRKIKNGEMSSWFYDKDLVGERVKIGEPLGECTYSNKYRERHLLLAGTGTGLSPLIGIIKDAIKQGHEGLIRLYHGALAPEGLYFVDELAGLEEENDNLSYHPVVLKSDNNKFKEGDIVQEVGHQSMDPHNTIAFVCGDPGIVKKIKETIFLKGVSSNLIFSDSFFNPNEK